LIRDVSNLEIKDALFSLHDNKAPGPDGYTALFFKKTWDIVGADFMAAVSNFFKANKMLS
jgi:hypothetical protein